MSLSSTCKLVAENSGYGEMVALDSKDQGQLYRGFSRAPASKQTKRRNGWRTADNDHYFEQPRGRKKHRIATYGTVYRNGQLSCYDRPCPTLTAELWAIRARPGKCSRRTSRGTPREAGKHVESWRSEGASQDELTAWWIAVLGQGLRLPSFGMPYGLARLLAHGHLLPGLNSARDVNVN